MSAKRVHTQANKADCLVGEAGRVVRRTVRVTSDHPETLGECMDGLTRTITVEEIVDVGIHGYKRAVRPTNYIITANAGTYAAW